MHLLSKVCLTVGALGAASFLTGCQGLVRGGVPVGQIQVVVTPAGSGTGVVTSAPSGINCGSTCTATFSATSPVNLTATPDPGVTFSGWSGGCTGTGTCTVSGGTVTTVTATFSATLQSINHIIFLAQENRSFDSYFGAMRAYWAVNGIPDQSFDGLPQFNPASGAPPLLGPTPTNPGCDPAFPYPPNDCMFDPANPVTSFHFITMCVENPSPSWNESHVDWDYYDPTGLNAATLNGFVWTAGHDARNIVPPFNDTIGMRAIGYYEGTDLNYYYSMASSFATSDRWFSPTMSRTSPNREYLIGATSHGYAYPNGTNSQDSAAIPTPIIFEELQNAGISWKIYVHPNPTPVTSGCAPNDTSAYCLYQDSYVRNFTYGQTILQQYPQNIVSTDQFITDAQNGTLPQVAQIEPASASGLDEHPADTDPQPGQQPCCSVQAGAAYVSSLINAVMNGPSWKDSIFVLTFDEFGGFYDHVPPQPAVSPDGIPPVDLLSGDVCTKVGGPTCDFTYTGYRVPLIVVSPFSKKNYVSHTVADNTAILKLIETRFNLTALTARDAAQIDMTEFFDFVNAPWKTPPTPVSQKGGGMCYLDHLP